MALIELSLEELVKAGWGGGGGGGRGVRNILQTYQKQEFLVNLTFVSTFVRC